MMKKGDKSANRRAQVLTAASACFIQKGFHAASMSEIARTASMSVGHIYHYFESKEEIISAIVDEDVKRILKRLEDHRNASDILESLTAGLEDEFLVFTRDHAALQVEVVAEAARNPKLGEKYISADATLRAELRALISKTSGDRNIDARLDLIIVMFGGIMIRRLESPDFDLKRVLPVLKAILIQLITDRIEVEEITK